MCKKKFDIFLKFKLCQVVKQVELHQVAKFHQNRTRNKLFTAITKILQKTLNGSFCCKIELKKNNCATGRDIICFKYVHVIFQHPVYIEKWLR